MHNQIIITKSNLQLIITDSLIIVTCKPNKVSCTSAGDTYMSESKRERPRAAGTSERRTRGQYTIMIVSRYNSIIHTT